MGRRVHRAAIAFTAGIGLVGGCLLALGACDLEENGLAPGAPDGATLDARVNDATLDTGADTGAPEASPDARYDGPDTCAPIETDCLDGIDDDCNGLIDCADPACTAGYTCAPSPSGGFGGFAIYESTRTNDCPSSYPTQADTFETLIFTPATCSACTCVGQNATCGAATLSCSNEPACGGDGGVSALQLAGGGCEPLQSDGGLALGPTGSCVVSLNGVLAGGCVPDGGVPSTSTVGFGTLSRVCAATTAPGGGCGAGSVCVARPPSGAQGVCISMAISGSAVCPAGYASAHATMPSATSFDDSRGCGACLCSSPAGATCAGAVTLYPAAGCEEDGGTDGGTTDAGAIVLPADGLCHGGLGGSGTFVSGALDAAVTSQGTCAPSGGQPGGLVTPTHETLYCCQN